MGEVNWDEEAKRVELGRRANGSVDWEEEVRAIEKGVSKFHGPREVNQGTAGAADISDVAVASMANDPKSQIRYYSQQMDVPEDKFGIVGGQIAYVDKGGKLQAVAPGTARGIAGGFGPSFPAVGGALGSIGGGLLTAPTGPGAIAGAAGGGVLGASSGQFIREAMSKGLMGQEMSAGRVATEGAIDLFATTAGLLVGKGLSRAAATRAAKEFTASMKGGAKSAAAALQSALDNVNALYGTKIKLTPAEITNSAKLRSQQIALGNDPQVSQQLEDFTVSRGREAEGAFLKYLNDLSPIADRDAAGEALSGASQRAMAAIKAKRVAEGSPVYQQAFKEAKDAGGVDISFAVKVLDDTAEKFPPAQEVLKKIRASMMPGGKPVADLEMVQNSIKEQLDDAISAASRDGKNKLANRLGDVQKALLDSMDEQVPTFKAARELWGDLSRPVNRAEGGILPSLAGKGEKDFEYMGARFLATASPSEIARAKSNILGSKLQGSARYREGLDAWNATLRGYLETRWEQAGRIYKSSIGRQDIGKAAQPASFWAELMGDTAQRRRLEEAMSPLQYRAFKNLMDVFEASGRALNFNSTTVAQLGGREAIKSGGMAKGIAASAVDPVGIFRRMGKGVEDIFDGANAQLLVDVITNEGSVKELLKIGSRDTTRDKAALIVFKALNLARTQTVMGPNETDDFMPPSLGDE